MPRVNTPCTHLTVNDKRYFIYPEKRQCCYCCNSTEGCGILRQDWLADGHYQGTDQLDGKTFDKWEKKGLTEDYWWVTTDDEHIPRKLQEAESKYTDYRVESFVKKPLPDSVFALPDYCNKNCSFTSICGRFRERLSAE